MRGRCAAVIQQLVDHGGGRSPHRRSQQQQNVLGAVVEALQQRAMLLYRLCRAKNEKLAANQTEDAAYCVLSAVAFCQPAMWTVLTNWSVALRPRAPELRFGLPVPMAVRLKDVQHFIARTSYLHPAPSAADISPAARVDGPKTGSSNSSGGARKHPREEHFAHELQLGQEIAMELLLPYFQLNVTNTKKLYAVVAAYEKEFGGVGLIESLKEAADTRMASSSFGLQNSKRGIPAGGGGGTGALPDGEEDDMDDYSVLLPFASSPTFDTGSSLRSLECFVPFVDLNTLAANVSAVCSELFYDRLQQCLRDPLLYSPLACIERIHTFHDGTRTHLAPARGSEAAHPRLARNAILGVGGGEKSLRFPAHFLHPARARAESLTPLPSQLVTSRQLWTRLLVVGLWLHAVGTGDDEASTHREVLHYCVRVARTAQRDARCPVCDTLEREKPILRLPTVAHKAGDMSDDAPLHSWEELTKIAHSASATDTSFCDELLRCLSRRLGRRARQEASSDSTDRSCTVTTTTTAAATTTAANSTRRSGRTPFSAPSASSPTLREIVLEVCGDYPLGACRAALMGGEANETFLLNMLKRGGDESDQQKKGREHCFSDADTIERKEITEVLDGPLCIPHLREAHGVLECAACFLLFHQECVCPVQREPAGFFFLCHSCRLARGSMLLTPLCCGVAASSSNAA